LASSHALSENGSPSFTEKAKRAAFSRAVFRRHGALERQVDRGDRCLRPGIDAHRDRFLVVGHLDVGAHDRREITLGRDQIAHRLRRRSDEELELVLADVVAFRKARQIEMVLQQGAHAARRLDIDVVFCVGRMGGSEENQRQQRAAHARRSRLVAACRRGGPSPVGCGARVAQRIEQAKRAPRQT
jgi:hypothetical protein